MAEAPHESLAKLDNDELGSRLHEEIAVLKETLVEVDKDNTKSVDIINKQSRNVSDVLQTIIDKTQDDRQQVCYRSAADVQFLNPIHDLLSVGHLTRTEIPLDVITLMITAGFSVNDIGDATTGEHTNYRGATCLYRAIEYHQYNVVKLLVNYAECDYSKHHDKRPQIELLASHPNPPLDLFDMLATSHNLSEALCVAVWAHRTETALHLIKLGARVNVADKKSKLPIDYFVASYTDTFNAELFMSLLPSRTKGENIIRFICGLLKNAEHDNVLQMLQQLIQRLNFASSLKVFINFQRSGTTLTINDDEICYANWECKLLLVPYLCSLLLAELQFNVVSTPDDIVPGLSKSVTDELKARAQAIDDMWRTYCRRCKVKLLLRLCILKTRNSMSSLDDNSFLSLPIPSYIRRLLTYTDVAERIHEEWSKGII